MGAQEAKLLPLKQAAAIWLERKKLSLASETTRNYEQYIKALTAEVGELPLGDFHIGTVMAYRTERMKGKFGVVNGRMRRLGAGPTRVNQEVSVLKMVLEEFGFWAGIEPHYRPLRRPKSRVGHALTVEEEKKLFLVARTRKRWRVAYLTALVTSNTTAGPGEIQMLRLGDVDLKGRTFFIREGIKNRYRQREVELNETAFRAMEELVKRAFKLGASDPNDFLLPHRAAEAGGGWDFTRPQYGWRKAWNNLREAAEMPWLHLRDLRHNAVTKLASNPNVSERTTVDIAGWVSPAMLKRYAHIQKETRKQAVAAIDVLGGKI